MGLNAPCINDEEIKMCDGSFFNGGRPVTQRLEGLSSAPSKNLSQHRTADHVYQHVLVIDETEPVRGPPARGIMDTSVGQKLLETS